MSETTRERERGPRGEGPPGISLLVRNLCNEITVEDLRDAFGRIGRIKDVYIPKDYHSQQPKGFAFIEMASADEAYDAKDEMDRFQMKGRELEVVFAQEKRKSPNEMRGRGQVDERSRREMGRFDRQSSFERHQQQEKERGRNRR